VYKIVACWGAPKPEDEAEFEKYYRDVHAQLAARVPGVRRLVLTRTADGLEGGDAGFFRVAELLFDNPEQMKQCEATPQWQAMREDAGKMVERFGVSLSVGLGWEQAAEELSS